MKKKKGPIKKKKKTRKKVAPVVAEVVKLETPVPQTNEQLPAA